MAPAAAQDAAAELGHGTGGGGADALGTELGHGTGGGATYIGRAACGNKPSCGCQSMDSGSQPSRYHPVRLMWSFLLRCPSVTLQVAHHALPIAAHNLVRCTSARYLLWIWRDVLALIICFLGHGTGGGRHDRRNGSCTAAT